MIQFLQLTKRVGRGGGKVEARPLIEVTFLREWGLSWSHLTKDWFSICSNTPFKLTTITMPSPWPLAFFPFVLMELYLSTLLRIYKDRRSRYTLHRFMLQVSRYYFPRLKLPHHRSHRSRPCSSNLPACSARASLSPSPPSS